MARPPRMRYSIAEWYGRDFATMTPEERQGLAKLALAQENSEPVSAPACPHAFFGPMPCNKIGGVCSIRRYAELPGGAAAVVEGDKVVTVCPTRFLQSIKGEGLLFSWIGKKMLDTQEPIIVREVPFLRRVADADHSPVADSTAAADSGDGGAKAGRIDWIVINPETMKASELDWCAVETQSLYFSGSRMGLEFQMYAKAPSGILFPNAHRRPDYRSSGPKRLAPQLDVKVPVLRNWGKKVAVVVDRYFYDNMNRLADAYPRARNDEERRDNAEVVWFVVDYDANLRLTADTVVYTTLESSRLALSATEPLSKSDFTANLKRDVTEPSRAHKVYKIIRAS